MIKFSLRCAERHDFESWFASNDAFEDLRRAQRLECPVCGSHAIDKAVMAPRLAGEPDRAEGKGPKTPAEIGAAIARLRTLVETNSDYVGADFAREARRMHEGEAPGRAIHGETGPDEARKLAEDGIPVVALPFRNRAKSN